MDHALEYTFKQHEKYMNTISKLEDKELRHLLTDILNYQIEYIKNLWKGNEHKIPIIMQTQKLTDILNEFQYQSM
ncbi:hypothetical protein LDC_1847 [sediment metagenome]|uniref:Uncharacterized protein n=1 Tax=sediment metagenome TaxID=749907 RepID=D9PJY3_9ZZZZ